MGNVGYRNIMKDYILLHCKRLCQSNADDRDLIDDENTPIVYKFDETSYPAMLKRAKACLVLAAKKIVTKPTDLRKLHFKMEKIKTITGIQRTMFWKNSKSALLLMAQDPEEFQDLWEIFDHR